MYDYWNKALEILEPEVSKIAYDTWLCNLKPINADEASITFEANTPITKQMITQRYIELIQNALRMVTNKEFSIDVVVAHKTSENIKDPSGNPITKPTDANDIRNNLIPRYVFENFVVGNSNQIAYAASVAVSESPGVTYNPLFLYGGVGLGKTHLMHSIAHYILEQTPSARVLYASCEKFTNELITAIREGKTSQFKEKYRNIDVLLIDDIQFISKKESTQEEFFYTFNELWELNKQIIISSDRPPKEIETLEERLRSRFSCGLIADIQPPDFETRTAILEKKAEIDKNQLPKEVFQFIAKTIVSNIRELEGALTRVIAYAKLANKEVTLELTEEALKDMIDNSNKQDVTVEFIQTVVAEYFNINVDDMKGKRRNKNIVYPRQIAMYLCRKHLNESLAKIGEKFGGKDHSTIIHGCDKIAEDLNNNPTLKKTITEIDSKIIKQ